MARRRHSAGLVRESQILARGAAHVLQVLRDWHPDRDNVRLALRCALEFEAELTEQAHAAADERPAAPTAGGAS